MLCIEWKSSGTGAYRAKTAFEWNSNPPPTSGWSRATPIAVCQALRRPIAELSCWYSAMLRIRSSHFPGRNASSSGTVRASAKPRRSL